MTGGLIQLVTRGSQDLFITNDPQITFFKVVYRRHTNFSIEPIPQFFTHTPDFGRRVTAILSRSGDLIRKIHLVAVLPKIPQFRNANNEIDEISKFSWVRRVGYALIKTVEVEIGDAIIDRQYGDWLNIWNELTVPNNKEISNMLGDVRELTEYTNGKLQYKLFIPLQFWFNRIDGLALPSVSLQYDHIKINIELNNFQNLYNVAPTHSINIDNDLVNFEQFEFIEQNVDGVISQARFIHFDVISRTMYISRVTDQTIQSLTVTDPTIIQTEQQQDEILFAKDEDDNLINEKYLVKGLTSQFEIMPRINSIERTFRNRTIDFSTLFLKEAFLLVEYIFLDSEERIRFAQTKHEYLIEQVIFDGEKTINGINQSFQIGFSQVCKELIWVTQLSLSQNTRNNDHFNYTDTLIRDHNDTLIGNNIITSETMLFNGQERINTRDYTYFNWIQPYQNHKNAPNEGINMYSFCLHPGKHQPSGVANLNKIDNILLKLSVQPQIDFKNTAKLRIYAIVYNVFRIVNGISGLVFAEDVQI
jgi:hypothetical protein